MLLSSAPWSDDEDEEKEELITSEIEKFRQKQVSDVSGRGGGAGVARQQSIFRGVRDLLALVFARCRGRGGFQVGNWRFRVNAEICRVFCWVGLFFLDISVYGVRKARG